MFQRLLLSALGMTLVATASATELDRDMSNVKSQPLKGTVVLRVDTRTNESAMIKTDGAVTNEFQVKSLDASAFSAVPAERVRSELDNETGSSSWFWYWGGGCGYSCGYYPSYYYYGYSYRPYYYYTYGYYNYYCYGNYYW